jgi:hypothetical protein
MDDEVCGAPRSRPPNPAPDPEMVEGGVSEEAPNVGVEHPVHALPLDAHRQRVQRLVRAASGTEPVRESLEVHLINLVENGHHSLLYDLVFQRAMPNGRCRPSAFGM